MTDMTTMTRRQMRRAQRANDYAGNIVPDGAVLRVPLTLMDGFPRKPLTFDMISDGDDTRDVASRREQRRIARQSDDAAAITAAKIATQQVIDRGEYSVDALDGHRPGFRYSDRSASDAAREARILQDSMAWRGDAAAVKNEPYGSWPLDVGLREGDVCAVDGGIGWLVRRGDFLVCELDSMNATRVPPTNPSSDSVTAADAEAIKREAWEEMCRDQQNAWRTPA
jgi:hypothetical protein